MALTPAHLQTRLARFEFEALFCQDLGWAMGQPHRPGAEAMGEFSALQSSWLAELSHAQGVIVVMGSRPPVTMASDFHGWLDQFIQIYPDPLVVWVEPTGQRSLWCWLGGSTDQPYWRSRCMLKGQGDRDWATRLLTLQAGGPDPPLRLGDRLNPVSPDSDLLSGFQHSWQTLIEALGAVPQGGEREHYAMVLLCRLVAIAILQRQGYLGADDWYLHNQFGQSQQRGADQFFQTVLQPLCHQGFTLPPEERPLPVQTRFGPLPFLPNSPFRPSPLDQRWGQGPIADAAFEPVLTWLGDWLLSTAGQPLELLLGVAEGWVNGRGGQPLTTPEPILAALCDRTLNATLLDRAAVLTGQCYGSIDHLLMAIAPSQVGPLLEELGQLTLLDPACGSGRFLVAALKQLTYLAFALGGIAVLGKETLPQWVQGKTPGTAIPDSLAIYHHLLTHSCYGVDLWPPAVELARLQLFLQAVECTNTPQDLVGLPDLSLTILPGNGLIGLVRVEAERFDQVQPRGRRTVTTEPSTAEKPLQGNLLQPLLADTYQGVLAERQVRLEHYRSQTQLLAEAGNVPAYAQADFLRDRLQDLNQIAQAKLTHLLWNESSQQLGIRVQSQDATGRRQSRLLEVTDVEAQTPFHWGFYFHPLLQNRGGFDIILSHFPPGAVQPSTTEFVARHQDLFQHKQVAPSTFLGNRQQVLTIDGDLAQAWRQYRSTYSYPSQYFRRSSHYPRAGQSQVHQAQSRLYWSRLFLERTVQLLRPGGRCGLVLDPFWDQANSAPLRHWLQAQSQIEGVMDLSNHQDLWPTLPPRTTVTVLWLRQGGATPEPPYRAYTRAANALSAAALGELLQSLIDLAE